jgi:hypothetical protein
MNDKVHLEAAYANTIQHQFGVLMTAYSAAAGDRQAETRANAIFVAGVAFARRVRDEAIRLSNQSPSGPRRVKRSTVGNRKRRSDTHA